MKNRGDDYLIGKIDRAINELVIPKYKLLKCYNYYNGVRDAELFRYLEENFGIGNPTSIEFTPLIRKHIDALIGEFLGTPLIPKVSCKDKDTLSKIVEDKEFTITSEVQQYLIRHLNTQVLNFIQGKPVTSDQVELAVEKIIEDALNSYVSQFEIAGLNVIEYLMQSKDLDLTNKLKTLVLDLLIGGANYYRVKPSSKGDNVQIEALNPLNTFVDRNPESIYVHDAYRAVIRYWLTKEQILNRYGEDLDSESIKEVEDLFEGLWDTSYMYVRSFEGQPGCPLTKGLRAGLEVTPGIPDDYYETFTYKLIPVYEVEWTDVDKEDSKYVQNRYSGVRIGQEIYVLEGKDDDVIRSKDNPTICNLLLNGIYYINRDNQPYSLVGACAHLQDKYDLLVYLRDNILANSGTVGDWLDLSMLPTALGTDLTERIQKFIAYKKSGLGIIDTSQEGRAFNNNTSFAGFDDTIKAQTVQAFDIALQRIEETTSSITGVFLERLNGIQQRDAVSNVLTSVNNSYIVTKHLFLQMDTLVTHILTDALNVAKRVYKKGLTGVIVLGDKQQRIFTALPEHYTMTDYDIHVVASSKILQEAQQVQAYAMKMLEGGLLDPDLAIEAATSPSITEMKRRLSLGLLKRKEETQNMQQAQQQIEELQKQLQQMQGENQQLSQKVEQLNEARIQIEQKRAEDQTAIEWYKARTERDFKQNTAENDNKRTDIELALLTDGNPYNDKIRQV